MVEICWEMSSVIYEKSLKMKFLKKFYNKKNKEENSTAALRASVKVKICWGNKLIYKRTKRKKKKKIFLKVLKVKVLGCGVCLCGWGWVRPYGIFLVSGAYVCVLVDRAQSHLSEGQCSTQQSVFKCLSMILEKGMASHFGILALRTP